MRMALEPGFVPSENGCTPSSGACLHASLVVAMSVNRFGPGNACIRGGDGGVGHGARAVDGGWHGHYWVEATLPSGQCFVVDITADQFGHEPVRVLALAESACDYRPGPQDEIDEAALFLAEQFEMAPAELGLGCAQ
jgi:hypothetical protein